MAEGPGHPMPLYGQAVVTNHERCLFYTEDGGLQHLKLTEHSQVVGLVVEVVVVVLEVVVDVVVVVVDRALPGAPAPPRRPRLQKLCHAAPGRVTSTGRGAGGGGGGGLAWSGASPSA